MSVSPSRRTLLKWITQGLLTSPLWAAPDRSLFDAARWAGAFPGGRSNVQLRRYRVDARVSLLSLPLYSKQDVGAACILMEELAEANGTLTAIQLAGGSWPEKLRGFNRYGMTQEAVREEAGAIRESAYLSFMTSSPEKDLAQARKSFEEKQDQTTLAVSHGEAGPGRYTSATQHLTMAGRATWLNCPDLIQTVRQRCAAEPSQEFEATRVFPTFLYAVKASRTGAASERPFLHNGKLYTLRVKCHEDHGLERLDGSIVNPEGKTDSEFRVWFDPSGGSSLPTKFEFHPRSFLRLTFQHDDAAEAAGLQRVLPAARSAASRMP